MLKLAARYLGLLVVVGVCLWLIARTLASGGKRSQAASARRALSLYAELERALGRRGHARMPTVTPLEHARALRKAGFAQSAEVDAVTQRYLEARFGGKPLRGAEVTQLRKAIARVRKAA
jgi:hypothetical protein